MTTKEIEKAAKECALKNYTINGKKQETLSSEQLQTLYQYFFIEGANYILRNQ